MGSVGHVESCGCVSTVGPSSRVVSFGLMGPFDRVEPYDCVSTSGPSGRVRPFDHVG